MSGRSRAVARALAAEFRAALVTALQYRASFWGEAASALLWTAWTVAPLLVVYRFADGIAGWTGAEALLVMGFFVVLQGLMDALVHPNLTAVVEQVREGTLDFVLLKPVDAQLLVSVHRTAPTRLVHALAGLAVVGAAASRLPRPPGPLDVAAAALLLLGGLALLHALFTVVVSASFWFVRVDNLAFLLRSALETGRWPVDFYRGAARLLLTFVLPVGVMTTWPARALRGTLSPAGLLVGLAVAAAFTALARLAWRLAVRRYESASS